MFGTIFRRCELVSKQRIFLYSMSMIFILFSSISGFFVLTSLEVYAQLINDRDNDGLEDQLDLCPDDPMNSCDGNEPNNLVPCPDGTFVTDCSNQTQGQDISSSNQIPAQTTNRECVLSSGTCTAADVLLDDNGNVVCDPSLGSECTQYLVSTEEANQDQIPEQNPGDGTTNAGESQEPGVDFVPGKGSEEQEAMILKKLTDLAGVSENLDFSNSVTAFRTSLEQLLQTGSTRTPPLLITIEALKLWLEDPGYLWGTSKDPNDVDVGPQDLTPTASCYASVPYNRYKCNIYVAEAIYLATGITFKEYQSEEQAGKYFPFRAADWANTAVTIPHFIVDNLDTQMGDIWSNGHHTGVYLGQYNGIKLYISARDNGEGVYGLPTIQREQGIQIKQLENGGVFRQYVP
jgi:hypothetical protein